MLERLVKLDVPELKEQLTKENLDTFRKIALHNRTGNQKLETFLGTRPSEEKISLD